MNTDSKKNDKIELGKIDPILKEAMECVDKAIEAKTDEEREEHWKKGEELLHNHQQKLSEQLDSVRSRAEQENWSAVKERILAQRNKKKNDD